MEDEGPLPHNPIWRQRVRRDRSVWLEEQARHHALRADIYELRVDARLNELLAECSVFIRVASDILTTVLIEGRFKTQFETSTSRGLLNHRVRSRVEENLWGIAQDVDAASRPIYGYLHPTADGWASDAHDHLAQYGSVAVRLKPETHHRTTYTGGDSVDQTWATQRTAEAPAPVSEPSWLAFPNYFGDLLRFGNVEDLFEEIDMGAPGDSLHYVEAQIHGGVQLGDIEEVVFLRGAPDCGLASLLESRNTRWRVVQ